MELIDVLAIITFVILLVAALWMLAEFYICDAQTCKAFKEADEKGDRGTKSYVLALLNETFNDGMWPLPYIGAAILTPLSLWFLGLPITVRNFAILFFVSFATTYFIMAFFGHHYIRPIVDYVSDYVAEECFSTSSSSKVIYEDADPDICVAESSKNLPLELDNVSSVDIQQCGGIITEK